MKKGSFKNSINAQCWRIAGEIYEKCKPNSFIINQPEPFSLFQ
jgi:hypothetical protein